MRARLSSPFGAVSCAISMASDRTFRETVVPFTRLECASNVQNIQTWTPFAGANTGLTNTRRAPAR